MLVQGSICLCTVQFITVTKSCDEFKIIGRLSNKDLILILEIDNKPNWVKSISKFGIGWHIIRGLKLIK